ncbi:hypothetical protein PACTADRAFT_48399, partial [Pachysolen tannophilus NRRL Y-2460]
MESPVLCSPSSSVSSEPSSNGSNGRGVRAKSTSRTLSRSRFGCEQCKARRLKCDENKPECHRCEVKGFQCQYKITLQFREDLEKKGKKFGREGVWSKNKRQDRDNFQALIAKSKISYYLGISNQDSLKFINFNFNDVKNYGNYLEPALQPSIIPRDLFEFSCFDYDSSLNYALNYYVGHISPILNPISNISNDFLQREVLHGTITMSPGLNINELVQYSQNFTHIFYLVLSLGSMYLSKLTDDPNGWLAKAENFQRLGLNQLYDLLLQLELDINEDEITASTDILLSFTLLILYEIANDCNAKWTLYLKKCKKMMNSKNFIYPTSDLEMSILKFCLEFLFYQESMGRTACKDTNSFFLNFLNKNHKKNPKLIQDSEDGKSYYDQVINCEGTVMISWMGCDVKLVNSISDITDLSFERVNKKITEQNYLLLAHNIADRLNSMKLNMSIQDFLIEMGSFNNITAITAEDEVEVNNSDLLIYNPNIDIEEFCFILSCEVKRLSTLVYYECCLLTGSPEVAFVNKTVKQIFKYLKLIVLKNDFKWSSTLIWSVFMNAVEISVLDPECESYRYLSLQLLERLEVYSLGNVNKAREIILNVWKKRDLNLNETMASDLHKSRNHNVNGNRYLGYKNDWELFVADENYRISL